MATCFNLCVILLHSHVFQGVWVLCMSFCVFVVVVWDFFSVEFILSNFLRAVNFPYLEFWLFMVIDFNIFFKELVLMLFDTNDQSRMLHTKRLLSFQMFLGKENKSHMITVSHWNLKLKLPGATFLSWLRMPYNN